MNDLKARIWEALARTSKVNDEAARLVETSRKTVHDARNTRHHARLLRAISEITRRARKPSP